MQAFNLQNSHLRFALGFIGTTDVEIIAVAGITLGPGVDEKAASSALARVDT
jgi:FMN-dependent NADH-azoreductase